LPTLSLNYGANIYAKIIEGAMGVLDKKLSKQLQTRLGILPSNIQSIIHSAIGSNAAPLRRQNERTRRAAITAAEANEEAANSTITAAAPTWSNYIFGTRRHLKNLGTRRRAANMAQTIRNEARRRKEAFRRQ
jgi:hypothetical protein